MNKAPAIGIDLGTCFSCASVFQNGKVEIIPNDLGEHTTPSIVSFDTERLFGTAAKNKMKRNPLNTIFDAKRLIGRKFYETQIQEDMKYWPFRVINDPKSDRAKFQVNYQNEEKQFYAEEILAMILHDLKKSASNFVGKKVRDAVVAVPNYFNDSQRQSIKDAATIAGLNVLRIINESTAAGIAFGIDKIKNKEENNIFIFDWGAGNLNVSILALEEGLFEVKAMAGTIHLGGEDLDNKLIQYCIDEFRRNTSKDINIRENPKAFQRIKTACEKAKIELSSATQTTVDIDCLIGEDDLNITITRSKFEELCADLFKKCIPPLEQVLKDAKMDKSKIDEVILVGGSTRIPKVQSIIKEFFNGKKLNKELNPDEAISYGVAIQAAVMTNVKNENIERIILLDVNPFSLGIETVGGVMNVFIPRNSTLPCKKTQDFNNYTDNQTYFTVQVFEGERQLTKDNNCLGKFLLSGLPPKPKGKLFIKITFDIDANSILYVEAEEKTTGIHQKMAIVNDKNRFNKDDIDRMVKDFVEFEDKEKEKEDAKINFDVYFYGIRQTVKDLNSKNKFSQNEKNQIKEKINEIYDWRNNNPVATKDEYDAKIKEIKEIINPIIKKICQQDKGLLIGEKGEI